MEKMKRRSLSDRLIDDWRLLHRRWSLRLTALGTTLQLLLTWWPDSALVLWNSMPAELKDILPRQFVTTVPLLLFAAAIVSTYVKQKSPETPDADQADG